jgi:hypothetical protein
MSDPGPLSADLKSLSAALKRTDQQLQSGPAPEAGLLNEFRQAVDNVRLTAWSVSEAINSRRSANEPDTVLAFLSAERLRRLDQLVRNLCGDIDRGAITAQNYGLNSLSDSVNVLQQKLAQCLAEQRKKR